MSKLNRYEMHQINQFTHSRKSAFYPLASRRDTKIEDTEANITTRQAQSKLGLSETTPQLIITYSRAATVWEGGSTRCEIVEWINSFHHDNMLCGRNISLHLINLRGGRVGDGKYETLYTS